MGSQLPSPKGHRPQFSAHICCGQMAGSWMDQDATWYGGRPWPRQLCVRWGPTPPHQKGFGAPLPKKSAHVYCGQTAGWSKMVLGVEVGLSPSNFMLDGDPTPLHPQKGGEAPSPFLVHFYFGQTAECIKMPLGMEVGLSPGDFVSDGDPAPLPKRGLASLPNFRPISIVAKRLNASRCHLVWR